MAHTPPLSNFVALLTKDSNSSDNHTDIASTMLLQTSIENWFFSRQQKLNEELSQFISES